MATSGLGYRIGGDQAAGMKAILHPAYCRPRLVRVCPGGHSALCRSRMGAVPEDNLVLRRTFGLPTNAATSACTDKSCLTSNRRSMSALARFADSSRTSRQVQVGHRTRPSARRSLRCVSGVRSNGQAVWIVPRLGKRLSPRFISWLCASHSCSLCRTAALWLGWLRDRKYLAHVRSEGLTKVSGVGRERAAFVPESGQRLTQRPTPVRGRRGGDSDVLVARRAQSPRRARLLQAPARPAATDSRRKYWVLAPRGGRPHRRCREPRNWSPGAGADKGQVWLCRCFPRFQARARYGWQQKTPLEAADNCRRGDRRFVSSALGRC